MYVCNSVYHCTSDYFWWRHFSSSQFKCSSVKPGAFTKQGRAAAAWQYCKEKLSKVNCSTEEAVNTAIQRLSHQPPPSHSKYPEHPTWRYLPNLFPYRTSALLIGISAPEIPTWPGDWEVISFHPFLAPAAWQCWILGTEVVLPKGRQLPSCYSIKPISHLWLHRLLWISRSAVQCHHVTSLFIAFVDLLLGQYTAALLWDICCLCLGRGLWLFSPSPGNVVIWHKPPGVTFLILS